MKHGVTSFSWILELSAAIWLVGFVVAVPLFVFNYLSMQARQRLWISSTYAIGILGLIIGVFHLILNVPWPKGVRQHAGQLILGMVESLI